VRPALRPLANFINIRYGTISVEVGMRKRVATLVSIVVLGLLLGGCTSCGWIWNDWQAPHSCRADAPKR